MTYPHFASVEEFVAWEERQARKYEFAGGLISLFPGGTIRHEILVANLIAALHGVVGAGRVRGSNLKHITPTSSRYADVSVSFDPRDTPEQAQARFPHLLVEVLSRTTHRTDRGPKFFEYRSIETLREYVLVDSRKRWTQSSRRSGDAWVTALPVRAGELDFPSIDLALPFDVLYAGSGL